MNITIKETPLETSPKTTATDHMTVTDARGRVLKLRKLDIISESRLVRMLGQDAVTNTVYMNGYVLPSVMVSKIDDEEVFLPMSEREMEALIQRLDNDGIEAVLNHLKTTVEGQSELEANLKK